MLWFKKNKDLIFVAIIAIWINFFPDTGEPDPYKMSGAFWHIDNPFYPFARILVPLACFIAVIIDRFKNK